MRLAWGGGAYGQAGGAADGDEKGRRRSRKAAFLMTAAALRGQARGGAGRGGAGCFLGAPAGPGRTDKRFERDRGLDGGGEKQIGCGGQCSAPQLCCSCPWPLAHAADLPGQAEGDWVCTTPLRQR